MGLFKDAETKTKKRAEKLGIDLENSTVEELRSRNTKSVDEITSSIAGSNLYSLGHLLQGKGDMPVLIGMARAQIEQNFILIRQNEEIIRLLKEKEK